MTPPEVVYTLAFSPGGLKDDGTFHKLEVKLAGAKHLKVEARRGYFAPAKSSTPAEQAEEEIAQALTSNQERQDIPARIAVQAIKLNETQERLRVVTHLDLQLLDFSKAQGENVDHITMAAAILDRNGFKQQGQEKELDLRLPDTKLAQLRKDGLTLEISFDLKPGSYTVREVFRDEKGALSALSRHLNVAL
jgi:hypothetical protein